MQIEGQSPHQVWLKCMQMPKCTKKQAQDFINEYLAYINTPLTDSKQTLLMISSSIGCINIVEECLANHATVQLKDSIGRTALHYAASVGSIEIFQLLIQNDGNPIQQSIGGQTPLSKACMFCQGDIIQWYLNNCIEAFEIADKCGQKPLQILKLSGQGLYEQVKEIYDDLINQKQS